MELNTSDRAPVSPALPKEWPGAAGLVARTDVLIPV
jgi:hypothetical protein